MPSQWQRAFCHRMPHVFHSNEYPCPPGGHEAGWDANGDC